MGNRHRLVERALDALLVLVAFAAAAWALLLSALCIGDTCPEDLRVRWWAWLAITAALGGSVLLFRRPYRSLGRLLLAVPFAVALVVTLAGA